MVRSISRGKKLSQTRSNQHVVTREYQFAAISMWKFRLGQKLDDSVFELCFSEFLISHNESLSNLNFSVSLVTKIIEKSLKFVEYILETEGFDWFYPD